MRLVEKLKFSRQLGTVNCSRRRAAETASRVGARGSRKLSQKSIPRTRARTRTSGNQSSDYDGEAAFALHIAKSTENTHARQASCLILFDPALSQPFPSTSTQRSHRDQRSRDPNPGWRNHLDYSIVKDRITGQGRAKMGTQPTNMHP